MALEIRARPTLKQERCENRGFIRIARGQHHECITVRFRLQIQLVDTGFPRRGGTDRCWDSMSSGADKKGQFVFETGAEKNAIPNARSHIGVRQKIARSEGCSEIIRRIMAKGLSVAKGGGVGEGNLG